MRFGGFERFTNRCLLFWVSVPQCYASRLELLQLQRAESASIIHTQKKKVVLHSGFTQRLRQMNTKSKKQIKIKKAVTFNSPSLSCPKKSLNRTFANTNRLGIVSYFPQRCSRSKRLKKQKKRLECFDCFGGRPFLADFRGNQKL